MNDDFERLPVSGDAIYLFETAVARVENLFIRAWACDDHNRPLFLQIAERRCRRDNKDYHQFSAYIVALAIGLID